MSKSKNIQPGHYRTYQTGHRIAVNGGKQVKSSGSVPVGVTVFIYVIVGYFMYQWFIKPIGNLGSNYTPNNYQQTEEYKRGLEESKRKYDQWIGR